jgi:phosphohistidine phosphatase
MKILLIRHARAEPRQPRQADGARALTADGRRRQRQASKGLKRALPKITHLVSSPLQRARETAEIIAMEFPAAARATLADLAPGGAARDLMKWLCQQPAPAVVALVGHEPDLGRLAGWLLTGRQADFIPFKKGAAALLEFSKVPRAGEATLRWLLTTRQLAGLR